MIDNEQRWYVVESQPHAEQKAVVHLNRQGFRTYLPRYLKRRHHARRVESVAAPLFPRYLFVAFDMNAQRWRSVFSTIGVSRIVCNGDRPAALPDAVVADLKAREDNRGFVRLNNHLCFRPGDKIRLLEGVFADCLGHYEGMKGCDRVAVLLDVLGRKVRVMTDLEFVAVA